MKKILCTILFLILAFSVTAYSPDWKVTLNSRLGGYADGYMAGSGDHATDNYDISADILQPGGPPSGAYIQIMSVVDNRVLTGNFKSVVETTKNWNITLIASDPAFEGISGDNTLTWILKDTEEIGLKLNDYGTDNTRTELVDTIELTQEDSYILDVESAFGPYRYLELVAEKIVQDDPPEETDNSNDDSGSRSSSSSGSSYIITKCNSSWTCTSWSDCIEGKQTRECTDTNDCNNATIPKQEQSCKIEKESQPKEEEKQEPITTETKTMDEPKQTGLNSITGMVTQEISPQKNIFIGLSIIAVILIVGLTIFWIFFRR